MRRGVGLRTGNSDRSYNMRMRFTSSAAPCEFLPFAADSYTVAGNGSLSDVHGFTS